MTMSRTGLGRLPRCCAAAGLALTGGLAAAAASDVMSAGAAAGATPEPGSVTASLLLNLWVNLSLALAVFWARSETRARRREPVVPAAPAPARPGKRTIGSELAVRLALALLALWFAGQALALSAAEAAGSRPWSEQAQQLAQAPFLLVTLLAVVTAPLGEEAIMRGALYPGLRRIPRVGAGTAALISSVAFGLMHANLYQFVLTVPLGMVLAGVYERTGRLRHVVVIHVAYNGLSLLAPAWFVSWLVFPLSWVPLGVLVCLLVWWARRLSLR